MAQPLCPEIQRSPDAFRPYGFPGMDGQMQSGIARFTVKTTKKLGGAAAFISADTNPHDTGIFPPHLSGLTEDARGRLDAEMTHGIKDPEQAQAEVPFSQQTGAFHARKQRLKL